MDPQVWPLQVGQPEVSSYSIKREFEGATVLITGASGYIGSVVLEQLLRTTAVGQIYLLLRPRRGQDIHDRADKLLQGAMFHMVRAFKAAAAHSSAGSQCLLQNMLSWPS